MCLLTVDPDTWKGKWFPVAPGEIDSTQVHTNKQMMGVIDINCDDGQVQEIICYTIVIKLYLQLLLYI